MIMFSPNGNAGARARLAIWRPHSLPLRDGEDGEH